MPESVEGDRHTSFKTPPETRVLVLPPRVRGARQLDGSTNSMVSGPFGTTQMNSKGSPPSSAV